MKRLGIPYLVMALLLLPCSLFAFEVGDLQINGFVSQGYMQSSGNNFLDPESEDGTFEINEVGLTFNAPISDKLHIGAQILSRDLGPDGNNDLTLDWALGSYRFADWFGVRAGKIKLPIGLYNETRDSDFLRPMSFLPQSVYDEMQRSFTTAGYGGSVYGNIGAGDVGDFDYQIFYGQIQVDEDTFLVDAALKDGFGQQISNMTGGAANISSLDYDNDHTFALSLIYNTPLEGLRLGGSYLVSKGKYDVTLNNPLAAINPGLAALNNMDFDITGNYDPMYVLSAEYARPSFTVSAEYMERDNKIAAEGVGVQFAPDTSMGWYVMGTVPVPQFSGLSLSAVYEEFYLDKNDKSEDNVTNYRKDFGIGARYDVTPNWLVKAEYHTVKGASLNMDLVNTDLDDSWSYFIVKTSFNF